MSQGELVRLLGVIEKAVSSINDGDGSEADRAVGALEELKQLEVTLELLQSSGAGKQLKKYTKNSDKQIADAATNVVGTWKGKLKASQALAKSGSQSLSVKQRPSNADAAGEKQCNGSKEGEVPSTGVPIRDRVRGAFAEALKLALASVEGDPVRVAAEVEDAMDAQFKQGSQKYKDKFRSLLSNLKNPKNPELRAQVLLGQIAPDLLITMSPQQMASEEMKKENQEIADKIIRDNVRGNNKVATTDQFQCGKCKARKATFFQMQTRSADEPMTTFVTCMNCNNRWKFC